MSLPLLQLPKTKQFFRGLKADEGYTLVYADAEALEPHVCAFYSRDPGLMSLYQIGRPSNDIYIFTGAGSDQYGPAFKAEGYDRLNPTKESIKAIKTKYSEQRQVCKKIVLGCQYGMGAGKLHKELNIAGFDISFIEAKSLWDSYWASFRGIKVFERELKRQWTENGGWIRGIRGEPITIPKPYRYLDKETGKYETIDYTKDIVNRFVQRGGHNIHMRFICHINSLRLSDCPDMVPFHVDLHDSTTWQVPEDKVGTAKEIYTEACNRLNNELRWDVKIKYKPKTGITMESFLED
jgi:hypothetical protein